MGWRLLPLLDVSSSSFLESVPSAKKLKEMDLFIVMDEMEV